MQIIFGTTNNRKLEDLINIINDNVLNLEVLSLADIGWDRGEIAETGKTITENSLIKANAICDFCKSKGIKSPILTDDSGLFVDALNGEPGVFTARYADAELIKDATLPKHYALTKLLNNLSHNTNRNAQYKCAITVMFANGEYKQFLGASDGFIDTKINEPIKKPYFYSLFVDKNTNKPFNTLTSQELKNTYRYQTLATALKFLDNKYAKQTLLNNF